ncbi:hypothetical protein ACFQ60_00275 [Streptomyces zhihengii]
MKSAEAAANPALEQVRLSVSANNLEIVPGPGGGLQALDEHGNPVFKGRPARCGTPPATNPPGASNLNCYAPGPRARSPSGRAHGARNGLRRERRGTGGRPGAPGEGDASAILPVQVDSGAVTVQPDLGLLRGEDTVYPVYIDPPVGLGTSERTVISSDGDRFWDFDGEYGVGKCGTADGYYCGNGYVNRMLFEFAPAKLYGKYVLDATFRAREMWSFNCTRTGSIWSAPTTFPSRPGGPAPSSSTRWATVWSPPAAVTSAARTSPTRGSSSTTTPTRRTRTSPRLCGLSRTARCRG